MATRENLIVASLCGTARRHATERSPQAAAVEELRRISSDPRLLGIAAGAAWARVQLDSAVDPFAQPALELLVAAGADRDAAAAEAALVRKRLGRPGHDAPRYLERTTQSYPAE